MNRLTVYPSLSSPSALPARVRCRGLIKDYVSGDSRVRALRGVDLDLAPGELTLLVGPSGCGKTTLISILAGTLDATGGEVSVLGVDLVHLSQRAKAVFRARNVGFVFQQFNLLPTLTAAENVAIPLLINGWARHAALARAREVLTTMGLGDRIGSLPAQLSGGQQQRVAIARALVHEPRLLVRDEPTSAVDAQTGQMIMELIRRVAVQPDRVAVVVTHDARVLGFGDRIARWRTGALPGTSTRARHGATGQCGRKRGRHDPAFPPPPDRGGTAPVRHSACPVRAAARSGRAAARPAADDAVRQHRGRGRHGGTGHRGQWQRPLPLARSWPAWSRASTSTSTKR
jgi:putative ABC transport system ATP-binding protein